MAANLEHLWPPFKVKVEALLADPDAKKLGVHVVSAFRSPELQRQLFADAVKRYGSEAAARKWVAPPGKSNHGPQVDAHGHEPGPYGRAVDFGVPGVPAVSGKWPARTKAAMDRLGARYQMHSPMTWEDWHFEPSPSLYLEAVVTPPVTPIPIPATEADMAMVVIDPKGVDDNGRDSMWEFDQDGNAFNWNGARPLKSRHAVDPTADPGVKIIAVVPDPSADGVVLVGNDTRVDERGHWVRSTWKITAGM